MFAIIDKLVSPKWTDLVKTPKSKGLKYSYEELVRASGFFYFAAYLKSKLQTNK